MFREVCSQNSAALLFFSLKLQQIKKLMKFLIFWLVKFAVVTEKVRKVLMDRHVSNKKTRIMYTKQVI